MAPVLPGRLGCPKEQDIILRSSIGACFILTLVAGCVSEASLSVNVSTLNGEPLTSVVVACVCDPAGDAGGVTDASGDVKLAMFDGDPSTCVVTVAKVGYRTQQITIEALGVPLEVTLEEFPP